PSQAVTHLVADAGGVRRTGPWADVCVHRRRRAGTSCGRLLRRTGCAMTTTAAERAYAGIRDAIISAELAEGAPIREDAWAQRFGISRTPVREALRRLSAEGL